MDLATVGDHAELWEKVVRKLRAGMMPPPGVRRPPTAEYIALRDWLETEIERSARDNPGAKVLHRLNRTEYANAIRDLLALEIDPATLLPADDSSRGFDNIDGSLTISPTLVETYVTAATKIARIAAGYWRTPTESTYIKRTDSSQNLHLAGLPLGTRGDMAIRHVFPGDGDHTFTVRNLGVGTYIPGRGAGALHRRRARAFVALRRDGGLPRHGRGARRPPGSDPVRQVGIARGGPDLRGDELPPQPGRGEALRPRVPGERPGARADHLSGHRRAEHPGAVRRASLITNFAEQWLYLRNLATTAAAQAIFPDWDDELREAFARETELLFESVLREDRNVVDLVTADYTFLNE